MKVIGTLEMHIGGFKHPWFKADPPMEWSAEIPAGKTAQQVLDEHFTNGNERLIDWRTEK